MDSQQSLDKLKVRNKIFVTWPVGIATICLGLVGSGAVSTLWGVLIGLAIAFLLWLAWILGSVLADRSNAQAAAKRRAAGISEHAADRAPERL